MNSFEEMLKTYTTEVNREVELFLPPEEGFQSTVVEAMNYSVMAGGKRIRPLLMRETYRMFGGAGREVEPFMAAIEMIHTFSLVHDDLPCMDNDRTRRGKETTWVKYGEDMAVLAGDALLAYSFETACQAFVCSHHHDRVGRAMQILAEKTGIYGMIGGQSVDVEFTDQPLDEKHLRFVYKLKTGALIEAAMMIGAILAGAGLDELWKVEQMAAMIGLAFQIQDDVLDVVGDEELLGKDAHSDEKNNKFIYVTIHGLDKSRVDAKLLTDKALEILGTLPGEKGFLEEFIKYLVNRNR